MAPNNCRDHSLGQQVGDAVTDNSYEEDYYVSMMFFIILMRQYQFGLLVLGRC